MPHIRDSPTEQHEQTAKYRNWDDVDEDDSAYVDLVQRDPVVCDTCFLFRYDVVSAEWWRGTFGWSDYVNWESRPDANERLPRDEPSRGMQLVCKNCGSDDVKDRPIPSHLIDEYTQNLSTTLRAKGIDHDPDVLLSEVLRRNTSDNQGRQDSHVFQPAVERAIRHAQEW